MKYKDATHLYEAFSHHKASPTKSFCLNMEWPMPQGVFGRALITNYSSNKFKGKKWIEYTHAHGHEGKEGSVDTVYPVILQQHQPGLQKWHKKLTPPPARELAWLGYALDIQYFMEDPREKPRHIDFKQNRELPHLLGDPSRNLLVITPQSGGASILLWSPILKITDRGIEN